MRKLKFFLAVVFIGVLGLLIVQNRALFGQWYAFNFDFYIYEYRAPKIVVGAYFIAVFLMGFLIAYFSNLIDQYRSRRIIRRLENELAARKYGGSAGINNQKTGGSDPSFRNAASNDSSADASA